MLLESLAKIGDPHGQDGGGNRAKTTPLPSSHSAPVKIQTGKRQLIGASSGIRASRRCLGVCSVFVFISHA